MVLDKEIKGSSKVIAIRPEQEMNVCTDFSANPPGRS